MAWIPPLGGVAAALCALWFMRRRRRLQSGDFIVAGVVALIANAVLDHYVLGKIAWALTPH